tara:strand:+ start:351 stop:698 length:348 start_codon:yes stop_codon:yes gene_type:complete
LEEGNENTRQDYFYWFDCRSVGINRKEETMTIDRYTKAVLTLIAIGLFVISLNPWIAPTKAHATWIRDDQSTLSSGLSQIAAAIKEIDLHADQSTLSSGLIQIEKAIKEIDCRRE